MTLNTKRIVIAVLGAAFLVSLLFVQWMEVERKREETGRKPRYAVPASSKDCVKCHGQTTPGLVDQWKDSTHARKGVGCIECHRADKADADGFGHYGYHIATVVTPRDCSRCHKLEAAEFSRSHHAQGGNILASLDNLLAETIEGARMFFNPHSPTPGRSLGKVDGMAAAFLGCKQCHGSKMALRGTDGSRITRDQLKPGPDGKPTVPEVVAKVARDRNGRPLYHPDTWPNTGIGRLNLDGSNGSCSACHSRHDFSPRRARRPENCGKCHLGPDHPQKEIYEESKHGIAYRDLKEKMNLGSDKWVLGRDYSQAPTCATCHMSGHLRNGGKITHDPGERISWTNRPPISLAMDTDVNHKVVKVKDPTERRKLVVDTAEAKRNRMKAVCTHCHTAPYVNSFYRQYDSLVHLYNEKFGKAGQKIMGALRKQKLISKPQFDEKIEWTWFYLWHHEGRRARHGAAMMAPDYTQWHGMYEVADRFYMELIPEARELANHAVKVGKVAQGKAVLAVIDGILARPEHAWLGRARRTLTGAGAKRRMPRRTPRLPPPPRGAPQEPPATKSKQP